MLNDSLDRSVRNSQIFLYFRRLKIILTFEIFLVNQVDMLWIDISYTWTFKVWYFVTVILKSPVSNIKTDENSVDAFYA